MSKYLELGKEVAKVMLDSYEESFFAYVKVSDIGDDVLESIGKELYENKKMFDDYQRFLYEEGNGFEWLNSEVNSYDFIYELVDKAVENLKSHYWSDDAEQYLPKVTVVGEPEEFLNNLELESGMPKVVVLNEDESDYVVLILSQNRDYVNVEHYNKSLDVEDIGSVRADALGDVLGKIIKDYKLILNDVRDLDNSKFAEYIWSYMENLEEFESVRLHVNKNENSDDLSTLIKSISDILSEANTDDEKNNILELKKHLSMYHNGNIDQVPEELFDLMFDTISDSIEKSLSSKFLWSSDSCHWLESTEENVFKIELEKRLKSSLCMSKFKLYGVLNEDIEFRIIKKCISDVIIPSIENESTEPINKIIDSYCRDTANLYLDLFLKYGSFKGLKTEDAVSIYEEAMCFKDDEKVSQLNARALSYYLSDILIHINSLVSRFDTISLYCLMSRNIEKILPYVSIMNRNGFSFRSLENNVANIKDCSIKANVKKAFVEMFKEWATVK